MMAKFFALGLAPLLVSWLLALPCSAQEIASPSYRIEHATVTSGYDGKTCWVHARAGAIPTEPPTVVLTTQKLLLTGIDVFYALHTTRSSDFGRTWTPLTEIDSFARRTEPDGREITVCDFTPKWHQASGTLLATGHTIRYEDNKVVKHHERKTAYATYDHAKHLWNPWKEIEIEDPLFWNSGAGCCQRYDLEDGTILLPTYHRAEAGGAASVTVTHLGFDGETLTYLEHGTVFHTSRKRGYAEPSVMKFGDRFFLTVRRDEAGYVTSGTDGLHFGDLKEWTFEDGSPLGSYNTQAHWIAHPEEKALYLVYTRRGANNDHVFRHRAPLFIAQVNPERLVVLRNTERIAVPERGARLGNFGITEVTEKEIWITAAEWMQPEGVEKYGSDNTVWVARVMWE